MLTAREVVIAVALVVVTMVLGWAVIIASAPLAAYAIFAGMVCIFLLLLED